MKLSEAIFLESLVTEQCFGRLQDGEGRLCVIGTAIGAIGKKMSYNSALQAWPWIATTITDCPACQYVKGTSVLGVMMHLNDVPHHWTRERIAEWVAPIEPQEPAEVRDEHPIPCEENAR